MRDIEITLGLMEESVLMILSSGRRKLEYQATIPLLTKAELVIAQLLKAVAPRSIRSPLLVSCTLCSTTSKQEEQGDCH